MLSSGGLLKLRNSLCFREANWVDMKMLWQQVILMMRYWHVLVPLKETDGSAPWAAPEGDGWQRALGCSWTKKLKEGTWCA
jgi:hypothetical protein